MVLAEPRRAARRSTAPAAAFALCRAAPMVSSRASATPMYRSQQPELVVDAHVSLWEEPTDRWEGWNLPLLAVDPDHALLDGVLVGTRERREHQIAGD